jgi:hypothetical protein
MRLTEIYLKEVLLKEFWGELEETLQIDEAITGKLKSLLNAADSEIFKPFGITKEDTDKYIIVGSARFYLYPVLRTAFNLSEPGDLDIVIPGEAEWRNLKKYLDENGEWEKHKSLYEKGVYRPSKDIEAFDEWKPQMVGDGKDMNVSSTSEIMSDGSVVDGYNFMSFRDIVDYKMKLSRPKEEAITKLLLKYRNTNSPETKKLIVNGILKLIGAEEDKQSSEKAVADLFGT